MAEPLRRDLVARRNAPFAREWTFTDENDDPVEFTDATVAMQVRLYGAQPGEPLIDLTEVGTALTEGLLVSAGSVQVHIDEATLRFLPTGVAGGTEVFRYDLIVDLPGREAEVWAYGTFTVKPGVTDRLTFLTTDAGDPLTTDDGAYLLAG